MAKLPKYIPASLESRWLNPAPVEEDTHEIPTIIPRISHRQEPTKIDKRPMGEPLLKNQFKPDELFFNSLPNNIIEGKKRISEKDDPRKEAEFERMVREARERSAGEAKDQVFRVNPGGDIVSADDLLPDQSHHLSHPIDKRRYFNGSAPAFPAPGDEYLGAGFDEPFRPFILPEDPKPGDSK